MTKQKTILPLLLAFTLMTAGVAAGRADVQVVLDGESVVLAQELIVYQNRTMIEVEDIAKLIGGSVEEEDGVIRLISPKGQQIIYKPGTNQVNLGTQWVTIEQGAIVTEHSSYLPLRWTLEKLGYQVNWDSEKRVIHVQDAQVGGAFVTLDSTALTEEQRAFVEKVKKQQGVYQLGDVYVIARGESANPGYGLKIEKQELAGDTLLIHVRLTEPEPETMYPQVISFPYLVGKTNLPANTAVQFIDAATGQPLFADSEAKDES